MGDGLEDGRRLLWASGRANVRAASCKLGSWGSSAGGAGSWEELLHAAYLGKLARKRRSGAYLSPLPELYYPVLTLTCLRLVSGVWSLLICIWRFGGVRHRNTEALWTREGPGVAVLLVSHCTPISPAFSCGF